MQNNDVLILSGDEVLSLLEGRETELMQAVRMAYESHARGESSLPHSSFLQFPDAPRNRIIALPAYLGKESRTAGIKWIASFPENHDLGIDRASATIIVNSAQTGLPLAIMEGSVVSAKRTAASAALAAQWLHQGSTSAVGIVGCGLINFEIVRFLLKIFAEIDSVILFDKSSAHASAFREKLQESIEVTEVLIADNLDAVLKQASLISFATTAAAPHVFELSACAPESTILHISLRDLSPEIILAGDNVVDDIDHVCRAQTSLHLAEQLVNHRDFIRCTLADVTSGRALPRKGPNATTIFSPFGLGILDIAVAKLVQELALEKGLGTVIKSFLPRPWMQRVQPPRPEHPNK